MSFQVTFDPKRQWATMVGTGFTDAAGFRAALLEVVADPAFHGGYRILVDARALEYTPTVSETKQFAEFHTANEALRTSKVAVVVAKLVDYGMANMFAILCDLENAPVRSFQLRAEAEEWLAEGETGEVARH